MSKIEDRLAEMRRIANSLGVEPSAIAGLDITTCDVARMLRAAADIIEWQQMEFENCVYDSLGIQKVRVKRYNDRLAAALAEKGY